MQDAAISQALSTLEDYSDVDTIDAEDRPRELVGLTLNELARSVFPTRTPILMRGETPVLCAGHLAQVYAERGHGTTWFALTLGLIAASGGSALGFSAPSPCRVLDIDGEMASLEIQDARPRSVTGCTCRSRPR